MTDPIIRVKDIAWIRLRSPDLDIAERYLTDFGLTRSERTEHALYMRGTDPAHHIHITEEGEPAVLGIAYWARSEEDLHKLSHVAEGASSVEPLDEPGGGSVVRLREYNGMPIEVVWGVESVPELPTKYQPTNTGYAKEKRLDECRVVTRPSQVKRIAHAVIYSPDVRETYEWMHRHLGFVCSDEVHEEDNENELLGHFSRIDDGKSYVDHHVFMSSRTKVAGMNHVSFEVVDLDDLMAGHDHLLQNYPDKHVWGIGRHTLGSQVFDYWWDPWERIHEHWIDSDVMNDSHSQGKYPRSAGFRSQWGPQAPDIFRVAVSR